MSFSADLSGRVALVTGASGGLGAHFAEQLSASGAALVLAARRTERLEALARRIEAEGGRALPVELDVADLASVERAVAAAEAAFGPVDLLVNNAGIAGRGARMIELAPEEVARVLDVNLVGAFRVATAVARRLIAAGREGSVINLASILAFGNAPGVAAYAASKAALVQLTRSMALEWARHGIRVNALAPGYIETDLNREFLAGPGGAALVRRIPQRRFGRPGDLDGALLLLASDASRYMSGTVITVDGGHLCAGL